MAAIWARSDTFAHGYLVAPTAVWLVWQNRYAYRGLALRASYWALFGLLVFGALWMAASLIQALVVQQLAVVGLLIVAIWLVIGAQALKQLAFPVGFLLLMVPVGEDLVPPLMEFTARFVVTVLRWLGITVYQEGLHFSLATGHWSVIEACSGIRYLIASITLGAVFAYLNYQSTRKRLLFLLAATLLPIVANGLRALLIVLLGHFSAMKLATGVDHIVYGWLFFGLVIWALFAVGGRWRDSPPQMLVKNLPMLADAQAPSWSLMLLALLCIAIWPLGSQLLLSQQRQVWSQAATVQGLSEPWHTVLEPGWGWRPRFRDVHTEQLDYWQNQNALVAVYVADFANDTGPGELINSQHTILLETDHRWRVVEERRRLLLINIQIEETLISDPQHQILVWRWYRIGSKQIASSYQGKWLQLLKRLRGDASSESMILLFTELPDHHDRQGAEALLKQTAQTCCVMQDR